MRSAGRPPIPVVGASPPLGPSARLDRSLAVTGTTRPCPAVLPVPATFGSAWPLSRAPLGRPARLARRAESRAVQRAVPGIVSARLPSPDARLLTVIGSCVLCPYHRCDARIMGRSRGERQRASEPLANQTGDSMRHERRVNRFWIVLMVAVLVLAAVAIAACGSTTDSSSSAAPSTASSASTGTGGYTGPDSEYLTTAGAPTLQSGFRSRWAT